MKMDVKRITPRFWTLLVLAVVVLFVFGSPSFGSFFWAFYNFRIFGAGSAYVEYLFWWMILAIFSFVAYLVFEYYRTMQMNFTFRNLRITRLLPFVPLLFSGAIVLQYFIVHNLFNSSIILNDDYPIHYMRGLNLIESLLPRFHSLYGFSFDFWAGYPELQFYPPGFYLMMAFFKTFGISIQAGIRLCQAVLLFSLPVIPSLFCRRLGYGAIGCISATLWMLYSITWMKFLIFGLVPFLLAVLLGSFFILLLMYIDQKKKHGSFPHILVSGMLLSAVTVMHFTVTLLLFVVLLYVVLDKTFTSAGDRSLGRKALRYFAAVSLFTLISTSFMWFSSFVAYINKVETSTRFGLQVSNSVSTLTSGLFSIFFNNIVWGLLLILVLGFVLTIMRHRREEKLIVGVFLASVSFVLCGLFFANTFVDDLWLVRFLVLIEIFGSVFVGRFFDESLRFLKRDLMMSTVGSKTKTICRSLRNFLPVFALSFLLFLSITTAFSHVYDPSAKAVLEGKLHLEIVENEDHTLMDSNTEKTIQWLAKNTTSQSRVLLEDSGATGFHFWGGHVPALMPTLTNRSFIGGYQPIDWYAWSNLATCREGEAFGVKFQEMDPEYFVESLKRFNVRYLVLWSTEAKIFANSLQDDLVRRRVFGSIDIFEFRGATSSYLTSNSLTANISMCRFEPENIALRIDFGSQGDIFHLSLFRYPNYVLFLNKSQSSFLQDDPMMSFSLPASGNFDVEIVWTRSFGEITCETISSLTWILGIFCLVFLCFRSWKKLCQDRRLIKKPMKQSTREPIFAHRQRFCEFHRTNHTFECIAYCRFCLGKSRTQENRYSKSQVRC